MTILAHDPLQSATATAAAASGPRPTPAPPELAIIVPTLNERDNVAPLLARLAAVLGELEWEAVFVDDESEDGTWAVLQELQRRLPRVNVVVREGTVYATSVEEPTT